MCNTITRPVCLVAGKFGTPSVGGERQDQMGVDIKETRVGLGTDSGMCACSN